MAVNEKIYVVVRDGESRPILATADKNEAVSYTDVRRDDIDGNIMVFECSEDGVFQVYSNYIITFTDSGMFRAFHIDEEALFSDFTGDILPNDKVYVSRGYNGFAAINEIKHVVNE